MLQYCETSIQCFALFVPQPRPTVGGWFQQVEVGISSNLPSLISESENYTAAASVARPSRPLCTRYLQMTRLPSGKFPMSFGQIIILFRIRERTGLLRVFNGRKATLPTFLWAGGIFRSFYFSPSIGHSAE